ncbi:MAG: hypothetical protein RXR82_05330 [Nitrososphaeria archaeon]
MSSHDLVVRSVLRPAEHGALERGAWAAGSAGAHDVVLMISPGGARLFAANDFWSPSWWFSVTVRDPAAAPGRAIVAPPDEVHAALATARGRGDVRVEAWSDLIRFEGPHHAAEVRAHTIDFDVGAGVPVGEDDELEVGDYCTVAVASVPPTLTADVAAIAPSSKMLEFGLVAARGWWLGVVGDNGRARVLPAEVAERPRRDAVVGRYPAWILDALLSVAGPGDITLEFTEPPERPALHAHWEPARRARAEFFVAPA